MVEIRTIAMVCIFGLPALFWKEYNIVGKLFWYIFTSYIDSVTKLQFLVTNLDDTKLSKQFVENWKFRNVSSNFSLSYAS